VVSSLVDLGGVHEADGNIEAAFQFFAEALRSATEIGDRLSQALALGRLGQVELALGRPRDAREHVSKAVEIANGLGDRLTQAESARRLAEVSLALGEAAVALEHARKALEQAEKLGSRVHVGMAQRAMAEVLAASAAPAAEQHFRQAIEILASVKNELELARCYRAFAAFREKAGAVADAAKLRTRADEIFGRLRGAAHG
jgi:tetratricopeptide (TPR) repeat protein